MQKQSPTPLQVNAGATWVRADLHLHSPGVLSFRCPEGSDPATAKGRQKIAEAYVKQLKDAGIGICAITDYNGVRTEWFSPIKELAREEGISVLPGAEVSMAYPKYGLHILAIFQPDDDPKAINDFIKAQHTDPSIPLLNVDGSHIDIGLREPPSQLLLGLRRRFNCLLIPAHPDQHNGFMKSMKVEDAAHFLDDLKPDAIEHLKGSDQVRLKAKLPWIEHVSLVEFSDPKSIDEIGTKKRADGIPRATYLKLSVHELDAIRLALYDPETRLAIGHAPATVHARILKMMISGSGFLGDMTIDWNDDLNVLIGGRGVGKSAVIETLRYGLSIPAHSDRTYREELVKHSLGSGGKVQVALERPLGNGRARRYLVSRVLGEEPRVVDEDTGKAIEIVPSQLLGPNGGPMAFGQREIFALAETEEYRLSLLDELIGEEARSTSSEVEQAVEELKANAATISQLEKKLVKRDELKQRLAKVEHELGIYDKLGAAKKLKAAATLRADGKRLGAASGVLKKVSTRWLAFREDLVKPLEAAARSLSEGESQQKALLKEAAGVISRLQESLSESAKTIGETLQEAEQALETIDKKWKAALLPLEGEINRIKQEAQTDTLDPDILLELTEEKTGLVPEITELDRTEDELGKLGTTRQQLVGKVRERRLAEHRLRRERAEAIEELLQGRLRLKVVFKGQKEEYRKQLERLLKGSGVTRDAINRLAEPEAADGIGLAQSVRAGADDVVSKFGLTTGMAQRLVQELSAKPERLMALESIVPPDSLAIELLVDEDFRPLDRLSAGQKATAILLLLFALEGRVLVLDQPEDDLDNRFVYEDIVHILRGLKGLGGSNERRQIIAATHNANIPVIGDAELVLALDVDEGRAKLICRTSIDDPSTRQLVKQIMEGGEEAFKRRADKYAGMRELA